jgi:transposase-like protein
MTGHSLSFILMTMEKTVSMTRNTETIEVMVSDQRRRRWSPSEKAEFVRQTYEMGTSVSAVARKSGIAASQLFYWRKL